MVGADDKQSVFLAERAFAAGYRTVAVVSETKAVSKGLADLFVPAFEAKGGKVVVREVVADGTTDFSSFIQSASAAKPDLVFFGGEYPVAATLRKQAVAAGLTVPVMGGDGIKDDALIAQAGADADGVLASSVGVPLGSMSSAASFLSAYEKAAFPHPASPYGPYSYDAANAIIRALKVSLEGQTTASAGRDVLRKALMTVSFDGVSGKVAFDQYGDTLYPVFTLYVVQGGKWVALA
jgi:branched-chain amino acid transport system substrate-binding protein